MDPTDAPDQPGAAMTRQRRSWNPRRALAAGVVVLAVLFFTGCTRTSGLHPISATTTSPSHTGYQVADNIHYSDHWIATPAVDLMSSDGTYIRAYAEADMLRIFTPHGSEGSYPGFAEANHYRNRSVGGGNLPAIGWAVYWVVAFTPQPDNSVTATICSFNSITPQGPLAAGDGLIKTLKYQRRGTPPPAHQKGPARAPAVSVFGDWYTTVYGSDTPDGNELDFTPCATTKPTTFDKSPTPTPGWPAPDGRSDG